LGIDCGHYSPDVYRRIVYAGTKHPSFGQGSEALAELAGLAGSEKQVERLTKRIGLERVAERDRDVAAYLALPLMEKVASAVEHPVDLAVVEMDGGRLQILDRRGTATGSSEAEATEAEAESEPDESERSGHWREDKIGVVMTMTSPVSAADPCPEIPEHFVDPTRILKLVREIKSGVAIPAREESGPVGSDAPPDGDPEPEWIPRPEVRATVATRGPAQQFKAILAQAAWAMGFAKATRKAFVADGAEVNWTTQKRWFSDYTGVLDLIHALSYVFAAAMAGRAFRDGWPVYTTWIQQVWSGRVGLVIAALRTRQQELGEPGEDAATTDPRQVVATTLGYLENHKDRMRYDAYRREGLPLTSCHVESTVKLFNRRVKGTEKFWSEGGAEAILQLRSDFLCETEPLSGFWERRQAEATGRRNYRRTG
jgi:hypothetical protein